MGNYSTERLARCQISALMHWFYSNLLIIKARKHQEIKSIYHGEAGDFMVLHSALVLRQGFGNGAEVGSSLSVLFFLSPGPVPLSCQNRI